MNMQARMSTQTCRGPLAIQFRSRDGKRRKVGHRQRISFLTRKLLAQEF